MFTLSDNYYLRKHYLESETVPTQSVMKEKMTPILAQVYFKSMPSKIKNLAGLEPLLKGGGNDWYVPPEELLNGRAVLKPIKKQFLSKLGFKGIDFYGEKILRDYHAQMEEEKWNALLESDINGKHIIQESCRRQWEVTSAEQSKKNTDKIRQAFQEFTTLYMTSMTKIEKILVDAASKEVKRVQREAFEEMTLHYQKLLKQQATMLYDRYTNKLEKEKAMSKEKFILDIETLKKEMGNKIHDINLEKNVVIEKLRHLLQYQNLACQVYVALKEQEECKKEMEVTKQEHEEHMRLLSETIKMQDFEIKLEIEKAKKRKEFIQIWQKKVCHVVKKFQLFIKYCLKTLPEQADFFINMEKLMLLQLSEVIENPSVESIFVPKDEFVAPIPKPHPFYLVCDKGFKPKIDETLCPKHCTSSASQLPVIIVDKKCVYSACDNLEVFGDKLNEFLEGNLVSDDDLIDDHDYKHDIPIKPTESVDREQIKFQSSLMQILQNEFPNPRQLDIACSVCQTPICFCDKTDKPEKTIYSEDIEHEDEVVEEKPSAGRKMGRAEELVHEREPKWESYRDYVFPKNCHCPKTAKKHLGEHLPAYMRHMSTYESPELPNYETCPTNQLKVLVEKVKKAPISKPKVVKIESKTRNIGTQYSDHEFECLCSCFSEEEFEKFLKSLLKDHKTEAVEVSTSNLQMSPRTFARERAISLRRLLKDVPDLEEIFRKENCNFYS